TAKGYRETTAVAAAPAAGSLRDSLERALVEDPDDLASHMAYADYLSEQGDPLGEFVRVQLALEDPSRPPPERDRLKKQEEQLLKAHGPAWLGELAPYLLAGKKKKRDWGELDVTFSFARGWLDSLEVSFYGVEFIRVLARAPQLRLLRNLVMYENKFEEEG